METTKEGNERKYILTLFVLLWTVQKKCHVAALPILQIQA